jgi:hypothetical protein
LISSANTEQKLCFLFRGEEKESFEGRKKVISGRESCHPDQPVWEQGDRIGRIFAYWLSVFFGTGFLKNTKVATKIWSTFFHGKSNL